MNAISRWLDVLFAATLVILSLMMACGQLPTQPAPTTVNEAYMLGEVKRFESILNIGKFIAEFAESPGLTAKGVPYAGWANCAFKGQPWIINFNQAWVNSLSLDGTVPYNDLTVKTYLSLLVGHEMCHVWVTHHNGSCYDEMAAEICANNLVTTGSPE